MSPLRFLGWVLSILAAILLIATLAFNWYGREESWELLFGPADLGPYDFSSPTRTGKPNDALACPASACDKALPELRTLHYTLPAATVFARATKAVRRQQGKVHVIGQNPVSTRLRAVIYSPAIRLPATLSLMVAPTPDGGSDLYIYSRSRTGYYDLGRNLDTIAAIIADINAGLAASAPAAAAGGG